MDMAVFTIVVAPPTSDANIVIPKYRTGVTSDWSYQSLHNDGYVTWPRVTRNSSGVDTITGVLFGLPYALRTDSLLKYLEKAPGANWEFVWVDGTERPDLKEGDKLKVTAQMQAVTLLRPEFIF